MFATLWQDHKGPLIAAGVALVALLSCIVVVPETEQAVVIRFGEPDRVINPFRPDADFGETGAGPSSSGRTSAPSAASSSRSSTRTPCRA